MLRLIPLEQPTSELNMEWDGADAESHISSSDSFSEEDARGREADDEQSDWQGYSAIDSDFVSLFFKII